MMCHGGNSKDPCGSIVLYSIGALGAKNKSHGKELGQFIEDELGIDSNRCDKYLYFYTVTSAKNIS